jgi:acetyltransferase-like isoleucine patch superfamily enzyme
MLIAFLSVPLPWRARRLVLQRLLRYRIHPTARIGLALVYPKALSMGAYSSIGHLTICKDLDLLMMADHSIIGRGNWITAFPTDGADECFSASPHRHPALVMGPHSAITHRHLIDCTDTVSVGEYSTVAGYRSQLLTHSINPYSGRQEAGGISIGSYALVGTNAVILPGATLPDRSILSASSLLNSPLKRADSLYGGVPARFIKELPPETPYFVRSSGAVD